MTHETRNFQKILKDCNYKHTTSLLTLFVNVGVLIK